MHREHLQWGSESAMWLDDVALWKSEYERALADLGVLEKAVRRQLETLRDHEHAILRHQAHSRAHESALAAFENECKDDSLLLRAKDHRQEATRHTNQRRAHENMKRDHYAFIAYWAMLLKEITQRSGKADTCTCYATKGEEQEHLRIGNA
jgi:hypothetical protein